MADLPTPKEDSPMFRAYLSFNVLTFIFTVAMGGAFGWIGYSIFQAKSQADMVEAIKSADVVAEFCASQPGLQNDACQQGQRGKPSDQLMWSILNAADLINTRDIPTPVEFSKSEELPPELAAMKAYLSEVLQKEATGVDLLIDATQICSDDIDNENNINITAHMLGNVYPETLQLEARSFSFSDASLLSKGSKEEKAAFIQSPDTGLRFSIARGISDAEIVSALLQLSDSLSPNDFDPNSPGEKLVPSYRFDTSCDNQYAAQLTGNDERYKYMDARTTFAMFVAGRIRTAEAVKNARSSMTLWTGPEQFVLLTLFAYGLFVGLLRIASLYLALHKGEDIPGDKSEDQPPPFNTKSVETWEHQKSQVIKKMNSARWTLKIAAVLLPAVGFIGTVRGIMKSLSGADQIIQATTVNERLSAISALSGDLGLAFATTFIALLGGFVLTIIIAIDGRLCDLVIIRYFDKAKLDPMSPKNQSKKKNEKPEQEPQGAA
jgi:MotA/TolQ/ExbB proton channel family protein